MLQHVRGHSTAHSQQSLQLPAITARIGTTGMQLSALPGTNLGTNLLGHPKVLAQPTRTKQAAEGSAN
jgi:hypothetical protein